MLPRSKTYLQLAPFMVLLIAAILVAMQLADGAPQNLFWRDDHAIFLIDMHNASQLTQSIGISSRFGWAHPGPLNYYLLTPLYLATGRGVQSLLLGTFLINAACLFGAAAIIARLAGRTLAGIFLLVFAWDIITAVGVDVMWDVLPPYSTILPWALALCLACAVAVEGYRWMPLLVFVLCFLTHAHVALWLPSALLGSAAIILANILRRPNRPDFLWMAASVVLWAVLWLPPLLEWRNLARIFKHFVSTGGPAHSVADSVRALAVLVGQSVTGGPISYAESRAEEWSFALGLLLMMASLPAMVRAYKMQNRFAVVFGTLCLGSIVVFVFALTRFTGPIMPHSILFITALGPALLFLLAAIYFDLLPRLASALVTAGCLILVTANWQQASGRINVVKTPDKQVRELTGAFVDHLRRAEEPPVVFIDRSIWYLPVGAVAQAYRNNLKFRIEPFWSIIFGHRLPVSTGEPAIRFVPGETASDVTINASGVD